MSPFIVLGALLFWCAIFFDRFFRTKTESRAIFYFVFAIAFFVSCCGFLIKYLAETDTNSITYEKPEHVFRTNFISTIIWKDQTFQSSDAKFYSCSPENILVAISHNTNAFGSPLFNTYFCIVSNYICEK